MTNSYLLCIGIDKYQDSKIPSLTYSVADCFRIKRTFHIFGFTKYFISLTNEEATKENIISALTTLPPDAQDIYIYYSAHGENIHQNSYLYTFDTNVENIVISALSLNTILQLLTEVFCKKISLILDACKIVIPMHSPSSVKIHHPNSKYTYEDTQFYQSLFTKKFVSSFIKKHIRGTNRYKINRHSRIRQDLALILDTNDIVYIKGKSGLGKSHLLRQIKIEEEYTFYVSLPKIHNLTFSIFLTLLSEEISLSNQDSYHKCYDTDPEKYIRFIFNYHPYCLLIIDHVDHVDESILAKILTFFHNIPVKVILASRYNSPLLSKELQYTFPSLIKEDILELIVSLEISQETIISDELYSCDTYITLLNYIHRYNFLPVNKFTPDSSSLQKAIQTVAITGGFIKKELFAKHFHIKKEIIEQLIKTGMIILHEDFYYPHDSIYEEIYENKIDLQESAGQYWIEEIISGKFHLKPIHHFILLLSTFSLQFKPDKIDFYKKVSRALQGRQNTYFLQLLAEYLNDKEIDLELRIFLCHSLINIGECEHAKKMINSYPHSSLELSSLLAEIYWWQGRFLECIQVSSLLLDEKPADVTTQYLLCSRGIGYFFLGKWEKASIDFEQVINRKECCSNKTLSLAYCVLATIQGIRGVNFPKSVENFILAIIHARKNGQISWLGLIYGNIGEIFWKSGYFDKSIEILTMGSHLAYLTANDSLYLEINRNLLHAYHRSKLKQEETHKLKELEDIFNDQSDNYVKMQLMNTLITHYIFGGNEKYISYLSLVSSLTKDNDEYYIYTLSNLAIAKLFEEKFSDASQFMSEALTLAYSGKNWLALKQCLDDWDETIFTHHLSAEQSKQAFQKWHQIVEIELLPFLHHLVHLSEYLELP